MSKIKTIWSVLILLVINNSIYSQCIDTCGSNLIPNPSFEMSHVSCVNNSISNMMYHSQSPVENWFGTDNILGGSSPDYKSLSPCAAQPNNANMTCMDGDATIGIFTANLSGSGWGDARESIQAQLLLPLVAGKTYCFSMTVNSKVGGFGNQQNHSDGIGAWFHNQGLININTMNGGASFLGAGSMINASPQVENPSGNLITGNCTVITGTFCAQGGEDRIVLSNFRNDANTQMIGNYSNNYMYIDNVLLYEVCQDVGVVGSVLNINCGDTTILTTTVLGYGSGITYDWILPIGNTLTGPGPHEVSPEVTTIYQVAISEANNCGGLSDTVSIIINVTGSCGVITSIEDTSICEGECYTLSGLATSGGTAPYTYIWIPNIGNGIGPHIVCPSTTTTYYLTVTDDTGDTYADSAIVTVNEIPVVDAGIDDSICSGSSKILNATLSIGIGEWIGGPSTLNYIVSPAVTTDYYFRANNNGCLSEDSVLILVFDNPSINVLHTDVSCYGVQDGTASIVVNVGNLSLDYLWLPSNEFTNSIVNLNSGTYTVEVKNTVGCTTIETVVINEPLELVANISGDVSICEGGNTQLIASTIGGVANYTYEWFNGLGSVNVIDVTPIGTQSYTVEATDVNNCKDTASINVNVASKPTASFNGYFEGCAPLEASFINTSVGAVTYVWNYDQILSSMPNTIPHSFYTVGCNTVSLIATSINGCSDTIIKSCTVNVYPQPVANLYTNEAVVYEAESEITIINEAIGGEYCFIDFGDNSQTNDCNGFIEHFYSSIGEYVITQIVSNSYGCSDTTSLMIEVKPETTIWVPNAFTPNDRSGLNDVFLAKGKYVNEFNMKIFNRWGEMIFESENMDIGWDGTHQNNNVPQGIYIWVIHYKDLKLGRKSLKGHVSVIK